MISSTKNEQVKTVIELKKKAKARNEAKLFVVEGVRMVSELPKERTEKLYVSESFLKNPENEKFLEEYPKYEAVTDSVFAAMSDTQSPQGVMALIRQYEYGIDDILKAEGAAHLMILENLQDPGNIGTILRTADAAGYKLAVVMKGTADVFSPKVVRAATGSLFRMPVVFMDSEEELLEFTSAAGKKLVATCFDTDLYYYDVNLKENIALIIGNEGNGISETLIASSDVKIKIPMHGNIESLNASVAAGILMYEAVRP